MRSADGEHVDHGDHAAGGRLRPPRASPSDRSGWHRGRGAARETACATIGRGAVADLRDETAAHPAATSQRAPQAVNPSSTSTATAAWGAGRSVLPRAAPAAAYQTNL